MASGHSSENQIVVTTRSHTVYIRLALLLAALALVATGCVPNVPQSSTAPATPTAVPPTPTQAPPPTPTPVVTGEVRFAAGPSGGLYQEFARAIADVWTARIPGITVTLVNTEGPADNLRALGAGRADVGLTRDDLAVLAAAKSPPFDRGDPIVVATLAAMYQDAVQIIVGADTNITTSRHLVGKKISVPPGDTAASVTLWEVLRVGTFRPTDFSLMLTLSDDNAAAAFVDKRIDVIMTTAPGPIPAIQQAAEQRPVRLIPVADEYRRQVQSRHSYLYDAVLPAGIYAGQEEAVETVGARGILVARRGLSEDLAYALAWALVEGRDDLAARHPLGNEFRLEDITQRANTPFHAAAVQYYREKGLVR